VPLPVSAKVHLKFVVWPLAYLAFLALVIEKDGLALTAVAAWLSA